MSDFFTYYRTSHHVWHEVQINIIRVENRSAWMIKMHENVQHHVLMHFNRWERYILTLYSALLYMQQQTHIMDKDQIYEISKMYTVQSEIFILVLICCYLYYSDRYKLKSTLKYSLENFTFLTKMYS